MNTAVEFAIGMALGALAFAIVGPVVLLLLVKWMDFLADKIIKS
jgi:hypothetical protein